MADSIEQYLKEVEEMVRAIPRNGVRQVVEAIREARDSGRRVFIMGNGGSAATASHMACDLAKTAIAEGKQRVKAIALTDNAPLLTAWGNDVAYEDVFAEQLRNLAEVGDLVIAISGSGNSPNVLKAVQLAREVGATTVGFTGSPGGRLKHLVDISVDIPAGRIEQAEDGHMILDHVVTVALREGVEG